MERFISKLRTPDGSINPWVIAVTVTLATFMEVLDTSIANVALPHIAGNLSASADESTWVLTSYLVSNAVILPLSGCLSSLRAGIPSVGLMYLLVSDPPYMKRVKLSDGFRIDYIGLGLISLGLGSLQIILDKGQRDDWFDSGFIRLFAVLMLVGLIGGVIRELKAKEPVVDFRMLKDRNFAISTLAMLFLGFVLYSSTVLIPQMLQQLLGYPAEMAGLALSPGGATIMFCMPIVGFLVSRVDTRYLITFGCTISASALLVMAGWNLSLDFKHAVLGRGLQSFGLAFLFIPINVTAFAYVPREKTNMGTVIINLAPNIE